MDVRFPLWVVKIWGSDSGNDGTALEYTKTQWIIYFKIVNFARLPWLMHIILATWLLGRLRAGGSQCKANPGK
jgi:hypothetical protein